MTIVEQIKQQALALPPEQQEEVLDAIHASLARLDNCSDPITPEELEVWAEVARARSSAYHAGLLPTISIEESRRRVGFE